MMAGRTMGNWPIGWELVRKRLGKKRQLPVTIFHHLVPVRNEFEQYFDDDSFLCVRACCRGAVPEDSLTSTLEEDVISCIQHADLSLRRAAMTVLFNLGRKHRSFLRFGRIRKAFTTPPKFALAGNPNVIRAILAILPSLEEQEDGDWDPVPFSVDALDALSIISDKGNASVIRAIAERTQHDFVWVRSTAVCALERVAAVGDQVAIEAALSCVEDESDDDGSYSDDECFIRLDGLQTLKAIAEGTDDVSVLGSVIERIEHDTSHTVRLEALDALQKVARKGNIDAISACVGCCSSENDDEVWEAALDVLGHLSQEGCKDAISACLKSLVNKNADIVRAAVELLGKVAPQGHAASVGCLAAALVLRSRGEAIDRAILDALGRIAANGDRTAVLATMQFVARTVAHEEETRMEGAYSDAMFEPLRKMATKDDVMVISFVASYLGSVFRNVRGGAAYSLFLMLRKTTIDTSWAWLAAVRAELYGPRSNSMDAGELTHGMLRDLLNEQGWLPRRRLRQKCRTEPRLA